MAAVPLHVELSAWLLRLLQVGTLEAENTCYAKTAGNSLPMRFLGCMMGPSGGPVNTIFCSGCLIKHVRAVPR